MKQLLYHPGDRVKVYFPGVVIRGEIIGAQDISVEAADDNYFYRTKAYLVRCDLHVDGDRTSIVTAPFLAPERKASR